jgi:hypothetical protein
VGIIKAICEVAVNAAEAVKPCFDMGSFRQYGFFRRGRGSHAFFCLFSRLFSTFGEHFVSHEFVISAVNPPTTLTRRRRVGNAPGEELPGALAVCDALERSGVIAESRASIQHGAGASELWAGALRLPTSLDRVAAQTHHL